MNRQAAREPAPIAGSPLRSHCAPAPAAAPQECRAGLGSSALPGAPVARILGGARRSGAPFTSQIRFTARAAQRGQRLCQAAVADRAGNAAAIRPAAGIRSAAGNLVPLVLKSTRRLGNEPPVVVLRGQIGAQ
jgi:hypothetical protein